MLFPQSGDFGSVGGLSHLFSAGRYIAAVGFGGEPFQGVFFFLGTGEEGFGGGKDGGDAGGWDAVVFKVAGLISDGEIEGRGGDKRT